VTLSETQGILFTAGLYLISVIPLTAFGIMIMFFGLKLESGGSLVGLTIGIFFLMNIIRQLSKLFRPLILSNYFNTSYLLSADFSSQQLFLFIIISLLYGLVFLALSVADIINKDIVK
jgi:hypothetical protein